MQPRQVGPYVLEAPLGEGGMATVYRGRHAALDLVRAVKVLAKRDPAAQERFAREASRLAGFRHPNLVAIHEAGSAPDGWLWFAMDLLEGEPLARRLARGPLPWPQALDVVLQAARGVDALHARGVVHRDLKPENMLMQDDGRVVVIDLGLALAPGRDERLTATGAIVGTVLYLAPEQVDGAAAPTTDVHALGLILYEALTGQPALATAEPNVLATLGRVVDGARPRPSDLAPGTPSALDAVVARATARDPAARYPTAGALADALLAARDRPGPAGARRAKVAGAVALALLGAAALAQLRPRAAPPPPPAPAPPLPAPPPAPPAPPPADEGATAEGEREARLVRRAPAGASRLAAAEAWLARFPGHPAAPEVRALHAADDAALVLAWLPHDKASDVDAVFVSDDAVVTAGRDLQARRWRLDGPSRRPGERERWREEARVSLPAVPTSLGRTPDRRRLLVGCKDGTIHELLLEGGGLALRPCGREPLRGRVESLALDPAGRLVVACDALEADAAVVALADGASVPLGPGEAPANAAAVLRDGRAVVAYGASSGQGRGGQGLRCFDLGSRAVRWRLETRARCTAAAAAPGGRHVAVGTAMGHVLLVPSDGAPSEDDVRVLRPAERAGGAVRGVASPIRALAWSDDGRRLYAASAVTDGLGGVRVWDSASWQAARAPIDVRSPRSLDVSPDGRRLVVGGEDGRAEVWSAGE